MKQWFMRPSNVSSLRNALPSCPRDLLVPPTQDVAVLEAALLVRSNRGTGRFDRGFARAQRLLSPRRQGEWGTENIPAAYGDRTKIVLFFTDGHTAASDDELLPGENAAEVSEGSNNGSAIGCDHLADLCTRMKAQGIRIPMMQVDGNEHFTKYARAAPRRRRNTSSSIGRPASPRHWRTSMYAVIRCVCQMKASKDILCVVAAPCGQAAARQGNRI
ncbi:MAG: hypothetical protein ACFE0R_00190 [Salinarimonas sp.]